jgi:Protein of unknown function (DUF3071)
VRAGASAETIAAETGWALDRVIRYAGPPLAERSYIAERASNVEIRRDHSGQSVTLGSSVSAALEGMGLPADATTWDAWRRVDGKWVVCVTHPGLPPGTMATWSYDHTGRNVHPLDESGRRFMETGYVSITDFLGLEQDDEHPAEQAESPAQRPRLVSVPETAQTPDTGSVDPAPGATVHGRVPEGPAPSRAQPASLARQPTVSLTRDQQRDAVAHPAEQAPGDIAAQVRPSSPPGEGKVEPKPKSRGKGRRASVPSWDEILFGASKGEDH